MMKFILNTAIDPHFCAIFDAKNKIIEKQIWENRKMDGAEVFMFLKNFLKKETPFTFLGGVTGPGGFSSLRAGGAILNAIAFETKLPIHQIRADKWVAEMLKPNLQKFLLNSFGNAVWLCDGKDLQRITIDEAMKMREKINLFVDLLPPEKREKFSKNEQKIELKNRETILLKCLEKTKPKKEFIPDYEFPAV